MTALDIALLVAAVLVFVTFVWGLRNPVQRSRRRNDLRVRGRRENRDLL
jgi:hypothetical protein